MAAQILDGRAAAAALRKEVAAGVDELLASTGVAPALVSVMAGQDAASRAYARAIKRAAERAGLRFVAAILPETTTDDGLRTRLRELSADPTVHGIIVQFPLPAPLSAAAVFDTLDSRKDVDGITPVSIGNLALGRPGFVPSTPLGGLELLRRHGLSPRGLNATVVGRSPVVGKPLALLLLAENATVTVCHTGTRDLAAACRQADLLCAAAGRIPGLIAGDMVKPGAIVLDFATIARPDGTLAGDVRFEEAREVASWISPVPGGTQPMTTAMLLRNTLEAARRLTRPGGV